MAREEHKCLHMLFQTFLLHNNVEDYAPGAAFSSQTFSFQD